MKLRKRRSNCPISFALDVFGDKWSLLVIRDLMFKGSVHYGDFLKSEEAVATNILAERLDRLEGAGLITRRQDLRNKTRVVCSLTRRGFDLLPVMLELIVWGAAHDRKTAASKAFVKRARKSRSKVIREIQANLRRTGVFQG